MNRRRGPRPGAPQRGNTATYDPRTRLPYRTTISFPAVNKAWLVGTAAAARTTVPKLLVDLVRSMSLGEGGRPLWALDGDTEHHLLASQEEFQASSERPYRVTVEFPPAIGAKLVAVADELKFAAAEVLRGELRFVKQQTPTPSAQLTDVQLQLPVAVAA